MTIHRMKPRNKRFFRTSPHFYEYQNIAVTANDIDLIPLVAPIACNHPEAKLLSTMLRSEILAEHAPFRTPRLFGKWFQLSEKALTDLMKIIQRQEEW